MVVTHQQGGEANNVNVLRYFWIPLTSVDVGCRRLMDIFYVVPNSQVAQPYGFDDVEVIIEDVIIVFLININLFFVFTFMLFANPNY